jgi:hypothetical protein
METVCPKKLIKSKSGLRIVVTNDKYRSPFVLCEPQWIPDSEVRVKLNLSDVTYYVIKFIMSFVARSNVMDVLSFRAQTAQHVRRNLTS